MNTDWVETYCLTTAHIQYVHFDEHRGVSYFAFASRFFLFYTIVTTHTTQDLPAKIKNIIQQANEKTDRKQQGDREK